MVATEHTIKQHTVSGNLPNIKWKPVGIHSMYAGVAECHSEINILHQFTMS